MSAVEQIYESVPPARIARRGYLAEDESAHHLQVAPRRALITDMVVPGAAFGPIPVVRENPRRRAPMRTARPAADRVDGGARRALIDADELLAAELIRLAGLIRGGDSCSLRGWSMRHEPTTG